MGRFLVIVLDGFGVGYMKDVTKVRPKDFGANTCVHILENEPDLKLPNLESLGLINIVNKELNGMTFADKATFGKAELTHFGADTFFGHQEIMGTKPKAPFEEPIKNSIEDIYKAIKEEGYNVRYVQGKEAKFLVVNEALTVADNIEADLGQAFNVTSALDKIDFKEVLKVGKIVRTIAKVPRVITFGGEGITLENILDAVEEKDGGFIGINAPKSGVYNKGYQCIHLGYGVDPSVQIPILLRHKDIPVTLIGKVADVVNNEKGKSISMVDTAGVLKETIKELTSMDHGFICTNVQETDLAGHRQNHKVYGEKLAIADQYIGQIKKLIKDDDIMIVMADHGNDPTIGHPRHTREMVPLMIYGEKINKGDIGVRSTLSDVGATVADYFNIESPENGESFLNLLTK